MVGSEVRNYSVSVRLDLLALLLRATGDYVRVSEANAMPHAIAVRCVSVFLASVFFLPYSKLKISEIILVRPDAMAFEYFSNDLSLRSVRFGSIASNSPNEKRSSGHSLK